MKRYGGGIFALCEAFLCVGDTFLYARYRVRESAFCVSYLDFGKPLLEAVVFGFDNLRLRVDTEIRKANRYRIAKGDALENGDF